MPSRELAERTDASSLERRTTRLDAHGGRAPDTTAAPWLLTPSHVLRLQRTIGNRAVASFLSSARSHRPASLATPHTAVIIQRKKVANLASGTDISTLMRANPDAGYDKVINFDTGHMILSDILINRFAASDGGSLAPFQADLWEKIQQHEEYKELRGRLTSYNTKHGAAGVTWGFVSEYLQPILQVYLRLHPGSRGAKTLYGQMRDKDKYEVAIELQELGKKLGDNHGFMLGDATRLPMEATEEKGKFDEVHIINAYGFDPLNDRDVYLPIGRALKSKGLLYIRAEATGPTVAPMLGDLTRADKRDGKWTKNGFPEDVPRLPIMEDFKYREDLSGIHGLPHPLIKDLATRHTVGTSAMMAHIPTVTVVFEPKEPRIIG